MGFPSPAADFIEQTLDLNKYLIQRPSSTFHMKISGIMKSAGISTGDLLVIDKSLKLKNNDVVVCWIDGQFVLKLVGKTKETVLLFTDENDQSPVKLSPDDSIWGVVIGVIKKLR